MDRDSEEISGKSLRNIIGLGFVSFFTDVSTEMCFSVLPVFVLWELGATRAIFGLIEGLAEATSYVFRMLSGVVSDKLGKRKPLVFVGYAFSSVVKPLLSVARTWVDALIIRSGDRVGKGIRASPRDALLSEVAPERHIGKAFGLHRTLDQLGAIVGPALAFLLMPLIGMRGIFSFSFIPGLVALIILIFFVEEKKGRRQEARKTGNVMGVLRKEFLLLLLVITIFSVGAFNFSFILLRAGDLGITEAFIPIIYAIINITHTGVGIPAGALSDKIGKERVMLMGYATFFLTSLLCMTLVGEPSYALLIAAVYGIYFGIVETVQRALIPEYSSIDARATAYGIYYFVVGLSFLAANTIVGALWEYIGAQVAFTYSLIMSAAGIISMVSFLYVRDGVRKV